MADWIEFFTPPGMDLITVLALVSTSFLSSMITVAFGMGGGPLLLAVLALCLPPQALIPIHGMLQVGSNLGRAIVFARHTVWQALPWFLLGSLVGIAVGGSVVIDLPSWLAQVGVGLFIIWSVLASPPRWLSRWAIVTGCISSFLTMFFGATGPFVAN